MIYNELNKLIKINFCRYIKSISKYYKLVILAKNNFIKYK